MQEQLLHRSVHTSQPEVGISVAQTNHEKQSRKVSTALSIATLFGVILCVISSAIIGLILFISTLLSPDQKTFFACILGVCVVGVLVVLCASRNEPIALLLFMPITVFLSGLTLGFSTRYV